MKNSCAENSNVETSTCTGNSIAAILPKTKLWKSDAKESQVGVDPFLNIEIFLDQVIDT